MTRYRSKSAIRLPAFITAVFVCFGACTSQDRRQRTQADSPVVVYSAHLAARVAAVSAAIDSLRLTSGVPGVAVVVVLGDSVILSEGFGWRDVADRLPVTPRTRFAVGSCTKPFTALAAVISADHGLLSLDDSPRRFLPYFHLRDPEADAAVTLRDLLSHRTGVPDDLGGGWFERYHSRENLIRAAMIRPPKGQFRKAFNYNNYMFLAAGEAIAVANHDSYEHVIERTLLVPLRMHSSGLSLEQMEAAADFAYGYEDSARVVVRPTRLAYNVAIAPAANINTNAEDMGQWLRLLVGHGVVAGDTILSPGGWRELTTPAVRTGGGQYALGWFIESWHGLQLYSHPGGVAGYGTRCEFLPQQRLGWVVLTNVDDQVLPKAIRETIYSQFLR